MNKLLAVTIFSLATLLSHRAYSQSAAILEGAYKVEFGQMKGLFRTDLKQYVLVSTTARVTGQATKATGLFKDAIKPVDKTFTDSLLTQYQYSQVVMSLVMRNTQPVMVVAIGLNERLKGILVRAQGSFELPVSITEGTWKDYQNGKTIRVQTTSAANAVYENAMANGFNDLISNANASPEQRLIGMVKPKLAGAIVMLINPKEVVIEKIETDYNVSVSIPL